MEPKGALWIRHSTFVIPHSIQAGQYEHAIRMSSILCPYCEAENIEGADECASCGEGLSHLSRRIPASSVEADLLRDRIERLWPKSPSAVAPEITVGEVLNKMVDQRIGCVMIVDHG